MKSSYGKTGVSQKAVIYRDDGKILTIRRTATAPTRPLHWDLPGGDLELEEEPREGIIREVLEETGLTVSELRLLDVIAGYSDNSEYWVTIGYTARAKGTEVKLSFEHDQYKWVTGEEFVQMKASPRNHRFVEEYFKAQA
ncbi:MAG: NUDIX hydrolase [bacterium]|nr:NUDIX hydrolase [bacterium]